MGDIGENWLNAKKAASLRQDPREVVTNWLNTLPGDSVDMPAGVQTSLDIYNHPTPRIPEPPRIDTPKLPGLEYGYGGIKGPTGAVGYWNPQSQREFALSSSKRYRRKAKVQAGKIEKAGGRAQSEYEGARDRSMGEIRGGRDRTIGYMEPYVDTGQAAVNNLLNLMQNPNYIEQDPAYRFRLAEGLKAVERSAAGRGDLVGGRAMRELQRYGEGLAGQEYGNAFNRLAGVAQGIGLPASTVSAEAIMRAAENLARTDMTAAEQIARTNMAAQLAASGTITDAERFASSLATSAAAGDQAAILQRMGMGADVAARNAANALAAQQMQLGAWQAQLPHYAQATQLGFAGQQNALDRALAQSMANKGYGFYEDQADRNQRNTLINTLLGGGLDILGGFLS